MVVLATYTGVRSTFNPPLAKDPTSRAEIVMAADADTLVVYWTANVLGLTAVRAERGTLISSVPAVPLMAWTVAGIAVPTPLVGTRFSARFFCAPTTLATRMIEL